MHLRRTQRSASLCQLYRFRDTIEGGAYLNDQELAWTLITTAPERIRELENRIGCFFDRNPDGSIHQKAFAGQSFDRTVHRGDLTGIEIMTRLMEQVLRRNIPTFEDHRAIEFLHTPDGCGVAGALLVDMRRGAFLVVRAKATLLATGAGPTMYRIMAPSAEKTTDGLAMAYRIGARCVDMEMVQFHPTGLLVGDSGMSGTVLEEGLRGVGGRLFNGRMERFMEKYDPMRLERSTRDVVSRSCYLEIMAGRGSPHGGVYIDVSHLGAAFVDRHFPGMVERCRDVGFDLAREPVEVSPTAHYLMGGVKSTRRVGAISTASLWPGKTRVACTEPIDLADWLDLTVVHKGGLFSGDYRMLFPADGIPGIKRFFLDSISEFFRRGMSCQPLVVGIGIGGTKDFCVRLAKESACLRLVGDRHPDPEIAQLEGELLELGNSTGFGAMGFPGNGGIMDVHIEIAYTHTGGMPIAIQHFCFAHRRMSARLAADNSLTYREDPHWFTPYYRREGIE